MCSLPCCPEISVSLPGETVCIGDSAKHNYRKVRTFLLASAIFTQLCQLGPFHINVGQIEMIHRVLQKEHVADSIVKIILIE